MIKRYRQSLNEAAVMLRDDLSGAYVSIVDHVVAADEAARNIDGLTCALRTQIKRADKYEAENAEMRETLTRKDAEFESLSKEAAELRAEIERLTAKLRKMDQERPLPTLGIPAPPWQGAPIHPMSCELKLGRFLQCRKLVSDNGCVVTLIIEADEETRHLGTDPRVMDLGVPQ